MDDMDNVVLRPAAPEDRGAIEALLQAEGLPLAGVAEHLSHFLVAQRAGEVVGAAGLEVYGASGLLRSVVVRGSEKGRSLGAALVRGISERARAQRLRALFLLTTTAADYFPRLGFTRMDRADLPPELQASEELRGACPASAVVMWRPLER